MFYFIKVNCANVRHLLTAEKAVKVFFDALRTPFYNSKIPCNLVLKEYGVRSLFIARWFVIMKGGAGIGHWFVFIDCSSTRAWNQCNNLLKFELPTMSSGTWGSIAWAVSCLQAKAEFYAVDILIQRLSHAVIVSSVVYFFDKFPLLLLRISLFCSSSWVSGTSPINCLHFSLYSVPVLICSIFGS